MPPRSDLCDALAISMAGPLGFHFETMGKEEHFAIPHTFSLRTIQK